MVVVVVLAFFSIKTALAALKEDKPTAKETPYEALLPLHSRWRLRRSAHIEPHLPHAGKGI